MILNSLFAATLKSPNYLEVKRFGGLFMKMSANFGFAILDFGLTPPSSVELENFRLAILD
jgi:hypothetical protein